MCGYRSFTELLNSCLLLVDKKLISTLGIMNPAMDNSVSVFWVYMHTFLLGIHRVVDYWIIQYVFLQHWDDAKQFSKVIRALCSLQVFCKWCIRVPIMPHSCSSLGLSTFLIFAILVSLFYFVVSLICIFWITKEVEHHLICLLAPCWSCSPIFLLGCLPDPLFYRILYGLHISCICCM